MGDLRKHSLSLTFAMTLMNTWSGAHLNLLYPIFLLDYSFFK